MEASQDGAGVPVFLYIDDPEFDLKKYKVSVGFSCRVVVNIENETVKGGITVPLSAVVFDNNLNNKVVFIYNPSTQKVEKRKIYDEGTIVGRNDLIVTGEVKAGEQVVAAGSFLSSGRSASQNINRIKEESTNHEYSKIFFREPEGCLLFLAILLIGGVISFFKLPKERRRSFRDKDGGSCYPISGCESA